MPCCEAPDLAADNPLGDSPSLSLTKATGEEVVVNGQLSAWPAIEEAAHRLGQLVCQLARLESIERTGYAPLSLSAIAGTDLATLRRARSPLGRPRPRVSLVALRVEELNSSWRLGHGASIRGANLSSRMGTTGGA